MAKFTVKVEGILREAYEVEAHTDKEAEFQAEKLFYDQYGLFNEWNVIRTVSLEK